MRLMGAIGSFAASMIGGLGIVQQRLPGDDYVKGGK
jgi:hypothetical protein